MTRVLFTQIYFWPAAVSLSLVLLLCVVRWNSVKEPLLVLTVALATTFVINFLASEIVIQIQHLWQGGGSGGYFLEKPNSDNPPNDQENAFEKSERFNAYIVLLVSCLFSTLAYFWLSATQNHNVYSRWHCVLTNSCTRCFCTLLAMAFHCKSPCRPWQEFT